MEGMDSDNATAIWKGEGGGGEVLHSKKNQREDAWGRL